MTDRTRRALVIKMPPPDDRSSDTKVVRVKNWKPIAASADPIRRNFALQRRAAEENRARSAGIPDPKKIGHFWFLVLTRAYLECGVNDLRPSAGLLLMLLASHADIDGMCFPSRKLLAKGIGIGERAVTDALNELKARFLVKVVSRGYGQPGKETNRYRLLIPGSGWPRET